MIVSRLCKHDAIILMFAGSKGRMAEEKEKSPSPSMRMLWTTCPPLVKGRHAAGRLLLLMVVEDDDDDDEVVTAGKHLAFVLSLRRRVLLCDILKAVIIYGM